MTRKALYAGSFNPFTIGHRSIVERALTIFDEVVIGVGINITKPGAADDARRRAEKIADRFRNEPRVSVTYYDTLTTEFAKSCGCCALLRGVRGPADMDAETQLADANRTLFGLETVILTSLPEQAWISSTALRDLQSHGFDISPYLG